MTGEYERVFFQARPFNRPTLLQRLNPIWLFGNESEPTPPDWYMPGSSLRTLRWYVRNPFQNAGKYGFVAAPLLAAIPILMLWFFLGVSLWWLLLLLIALGGVEHVDHVATGPAPVDVTTWTDLDPTMTGWKWSLIMLWGWLPLPFVAFENRWMIFYWGWQAVGFFGVKFNFKFGPEIA